VSNELQQLLADRRSERGEPGEFDWMERASDQQLVEFIETGIVPKDLGRLNLCVGLEQPPRDRWIRKPARTARNCRDKLSPLGRAFNVDVVWCRRCFIGCGRVDRSWI
jgi:hypothetical protein